MTWRENHKSYNTAQNHNTIQSSTNQPAASCRVGLKKKNWAVKLFCSIFKQEFTPRALLLGVGLGKVIIKTGICLFGRTVSLGMWSYCGPPSPSFHNPDNSYNLWLNKTKIINYSFLSSFQVDGCKLPLKNKNKIKK